MDNLMGSMAPFSPVHQNHSNHSTPTLPRKKSTVADAVQGANQFGLNVFRLQSSTDQQDTNTVLSPKSFTSALQVVAFGSSGKTKAQVEDALGGIPLGVHFSTNQDLKTNVQKFRNIAEKTKAKLLRKMSSVDGSVTRSHSVDVPAVSRSNSVEDKAAPYTVVNKVCIKKGLNVEKGYTSGVKAFFGAKTETMDFQGHSDKCRENINSWVSRHTEGKVKDMLSKENVTASTFMVIVNAVYFKGDWEDKFDKSSTHVRPFITTHGVAEVDFMFKKSDTLYCDYRDLNCRAIELPYVGKELSFVVILPDTDNGLPQLEQNLNIDTFQYIFQNMHTTSDLLLYLPKFKMETTVELSHSFAKLGMVDLFTEGQADLRGIESKGLLYVSGIAHKACIEVNEEGTEAAAATADVLRSAGGKQREYTVFDAKHPFIFLIKDNSTNMILFMGKYCNPSSL